MLRQASESQHTSSTQWPNAHCWSAEHAVPEIAGAAHSPVLQYCPCGQAGKPFKSQQNPSTQELLGWHCWSDSHEFPFGPGGEHVPGLPAMLQNSPDAQRDLRPAVVHAEVAFALAVESAWVCDRLRRRRDAPQDPYRVTGVFRDRNVQHSIAGKVPGRDTARPQADVHAGGEVKQPVSASSIDADEAGEYRCRGCCLGAEGHGEIIEAVAIEVSVDDVRGVQVTGTPLTCVPGRLL